MELTDIYLFNDDYKRGVVLLEATHDWDWACTDEVREWWGDYVYSAFSGRMLQMGDYTNIPFPLVFSQDTGSEYKDVLGIEWGNVFVVSDRFREVLEKNHFTGWKCYPVKIFNKEGEEVFGYQGFSITGRAGRIDWDKCEKLQKPSSFYPQEMRTFYKGMPLEVSEWDGSDFFLSKRYIENFVTKRVRDALVEAGVTSVRFDEVAEILTCEDDVERHRVK